MIAGSHVAGLGFLAGGFDLRSRDDLPQFDARPLLAGLAAIDVMAQQNTVHAVVSDRDVTDAFGARAALSLPFAR